MVPQDSYFRSVSRKESLESQQKDAQKNRLLRAVFCLNDNFNSEYNRKMPIRKRMSTLDQICFKYEQWFHPIQCTAGIICQYGATDKTVLARESGILAISDQFHYF